MSEQSLPHPIPPPAKRPRIGTDGMVSSVGTAHLSPDLWAIVLMFLPYRDILRGTILNRTFLREVSPKVRSIRIHTANQMRAIPARRFAGVTDIAIECLFQCSFDQMAFDREAVGMVVPFLCCFHFFFAFSLFNFLFSLKLSLGFFIVLESLNDFPLYLFDISSFLAGPEGLEPSTSESVAPRSIQLS